MIYRFLLIFLAVLVIYRAVRRLLLPSRGRGEVRGANREVVDKGEMVRDPVCGTYVPREGSIHHLEGGTEHFFCSPGCRDEFSQGKNRTGGYGESGR